MKKLLGYLAGIVLVALLLVILVPSLYGMAWLLAVCLPPICAFASIQDAREQGQLGNPRVLATKLLLAVLVLPVAIMAFAAPLRAVLLAVLSFFPMGMAKFQELHAPFYDLLTPVYGDLFPYWLDLYWGVFSLLTIFLIALIDSVRRNKLGRQIEILPTAKIRSVAVGLAELKGRAVPLGGSSARTPIMRSWLESTGDGARTMTHIEPFYLDDGTGRILVDPRGASINDEGQFFRVGMHQAILKRFEKKTGFPESRLTPGDTVYVVGNVQINRDGSDGADNDAIVIKPNKPSMLSLNFFDLFFVSNLGEQALLDGFRKSINRGWVKVFVGMSFGAWLSAFALTNIMQIESSSVDAAPLYLRLVSTPTTLEREIDVSGLGRHATIHFVNMLDAGDSERTDTIMARFRELRLVPLALPALRDQALAIDHPGFGIANDWLSRLRETPPGHWGLEYFDGRYINEKEALVLRLMTRYADNRLYVSYRAYAGTERYRNPHDVRSKKVVIELESKESGKTFTAEFDADVGYNGVDDMEAFEFLYPGEYELDAYLKTSYRSGLYDRGSRTRSGLAIRLAE